jgi:hypothetical protein
MTDITPADDDGTPTVRPLAELRTTGLLWLINRTVLHPRGYALGFDLDADGNAVGWVLLGDGTESWNYDESVDENELFRNVEALFASLRPDDREGHT